MVDETVRFGDGNGPKPVGVEGADEETAEALTIVGVPVVPEAAITEAEQECAPASVPSSANAPFRQSNAIRGCANAALFDLYGRMETRGPKSKSVPETARSRLLSIADIPGQADDGKGEETVTGSELAKTRQRLAFRMHVYNYKMGIRGTMSEDLMDFVVRKKEEHYIDKFKNQNALMKTFGEDGIKVYVVLDENKTMGQMLQESGVSEDKFIEILDFMDKEGMVKLEHSMPETALLKSAGPGKAEMPMEKKASAGQAYAGPGKAAVSPNIRITPQTDADGEPQVPIVEQAPEQPRPPVPGIRRDEHTSTPLPPEYRQEKVLQPKEEFVPPMKKRGANIEIKQAEEEIDKGGSGIEAPKPEDLLSPLERIIFEKFGREGVDVYNLIDGERTAEQILNETGVSEVKLVEILEFMDDEGLIKLEKPGGGGKEPPGKPEPKETQFEPILDDRDEIPDSLATPQEREHLTPVTLPVPQRLGLFGSMETKLKLSLKYMGKGRKLLSAIDGKKDVVELSKELNLTFDEIDKILVTLTKRKVVSIKPLSDEDIKDRYGTDGLKIAKKFGRDGILIYELIGREKSIKDVILRSRVEPKRAVDIVMHIHKILGLGLSLDRGVLYKQLGIREAPN